MLLSTSKIIQSIISKLFKEFIYGGHLQSLGAAGIALIASIFLGTKFSWDCFISVYLIFYPLYLYNRFKEIEFDEITNPERTQHFQSYIKIIPLIFWIDIFLAIILISIKSNLTTLIFSFVLIFFGLLYTKTFKGYTRKIVILKNIYVSSFFAILIVFPVIYYNKNLSETLIYKSAILILFIFLKAFIMQVFLDIKDIDSDKQEKLLTIPIIFGKDKTINFLIFFDFIITAFFPILFTLVLKIFSEITWLFSISFLSLFLSYKMVKKNNYNAYILRSGEFFFWLLIFHTFLMYY